MKAFNIYLCGVGGQGIGLLAEVLLRAIDYAGFPAKAVDTHGLAQRGGIVVSHLRYGDNIFSPMVPAGKSDLVVALERHEALRGAESMLQQGGTLIYYNTVLQPLGVRLGKDIEVSEELIEKFCESADIKLFAVADEDLADPRTQNIVVLAHINKLRLLPGVNREHMEKALGDLLAGSLLEKNLKLFDSLA
ncbi:MAG: 2-oxoacid:acceptor oxidoreductase family protein [Desulfocapsaceae bacterium]|nr:2-oxoacid:acceptor oxidoreductase family protein [Desulfocapsaceae bacterium]